MTLSVEDRLAIHEIIAWHGHLADSRELGRMDEVFTPDAVFDLQDFGAGTVEGLAALRTLADAIVEHPVGHHVTNIVLSQSGDGRVRAQSKGIAVNADGSCSSVLYEDSVLRCPQGWRITQRRVSAPRGAERQ
jgi:hypothetical protein